MMILLTVTILSAWSITSLAAGLGLGAVIGMAERAQKQVFLEALLATLSERQMSR